LLLVTNNLPVFTGSCEMAGQTSFNFYSTELCLLYKANVVECKSNNASGQLIL